MFASQQRGRKLSFLVVFVEREIARSERQSQLAQKESRDSPQSKSHPNRVTQVSNRTFATLADEVEGAGGGAGGAVFGAQMLSVAARQRVALGAVGVFRGREGVR